MLALNPTLVAGFWSGNVFAQSLIRRFNSWLHRYSLSICGVRDLALSVVGRVCGLVAPEVSHRKSEIHSRVGKFAQNLHVGDVAVEAEKKGLKPCFKHARFLVFRRPTRKALDVIQRAFVLQ